MHGKLRVLMCDYNRQKIYWIREAYFSDETGARGLSSVYEYLPNDGRIRIQFYNDGSKSIFRYPSSSGNHPTGGIVYDAEGNLNSISDYDSELSHLKDTFYRKDGTIERIIDYDPSPYSSKILKKTFLEEDGKTINKIAMPEYKDREIIRIKEYHPDDMENVKTTIDFKDFGHLWGYSGTGYDSISKKQTDYQMINGKNRKIKENFFIKAKDTIPKFTVDFNPTTGYAAKKIDYYKDGDISSILDYDSTTGNRLKETEYRGDGTIACVVDYNPRIARQELKTTFFQKDGKAISSIYELKYDDKGYKTYEKVTHYQEDGKTIKEICDQDYIQNSKEEKCYWADGKTIKSFIKHTRSSINGIFYQEDGTIKRTYKKDRITSKFEDIYYYEDGKTIKRIATPELDEKGNEIIKEKYCQKDGTVTSIIEYEDTPYKRILKPNDDKYKKIITDYDYKYLNAEDARTLESLRKHQNIWAPIDFLESNKRILQTQTYYSDNAVVEEKRNEIIISKVRRFELM